MDAVNKVIADHAESEDLVDKPEAVPGVVRVCGPFTVEAVQPPAISLGEETVVEFGGAPEELESFDDDGAAIPPVTIREAIPAGALQAENPAAYIEQMLRLLRTSGVMFLDNKSKVFSRLDAIGSTSGGVPIHGEGRWHLKGETDDDPQGEPNVAVCIGPQYGSISAHDISNARREAHRNNYDHLVFAGFSFDAAATAEIETKTRLQVQTHMAHIRPDANPVMNDLLKESGSDQMFSVFGAPRVKVHKPDADGLVRVEMQGVDIFDPVKNEVVANPKDKVAAWFLDGDYDGTVFCTTQAFFPDKSAWDKLERALKASFDAEVWKQLSGTVSLPFAPGEHRRAAVKVIDPRGNEVMQVVAL
jgi:adenine-specific DNA-methyltransferase